MVQNRYYVVLPFSRSADDVLTPGDPIGATDTDTATMLANSLAGSHGGAVVFARGRGPDGIVQDLEVLRHVGDVPDDLSRFMLKGRS